MLPIGAKFKVIKTSQDKIFVKDEIWTLIGKISNNTYYIQWICDKGTKVTKPVSKNTILSYFEPESKIIKVLYENADK